MVCLQRQAGLNKATCALINSGKIKCLKNRCQEHQPASTI